jgi:SAM-dependent methyltransferase
LSPTARSGTRSPDTGRPRTSLKPLLLLGIALGIASFAAGAFIVGARAVTPTHSLSGRPIAGLATDIPWLERSSREQEEEPERALDLIGIAPGTVIADVGAGSGYLTLRLASRVGPTGKVYANELQPAMLRVIADKVREQHVVNVDLVQGTERDTRLPDDAVDLALLVDVYHEFRYPRDMLQSIRRALKPDGRLVLAEYRKEDPRIPIAFTHRMSVAEARLEVEAEGFRFDQVIAGLPRQHIIVFRKPSL